MSPSFLPPLPERISRSQGTSLVHDPGDVVPVAGELPLLGRVGAPLSRPRTGGGAATGLTTAGLTTAGLTPLTTAGLTTAGLTTGAPWAHGGTTPWVPSPGPDVPAKTGPATATEVRTPDAAAVTQKPLRNRPARQLERAVIANPRCLRKSPIPFVGRQSSAE